MRVVPAKQMRKLCVSGVESLTRLGESSPCGEGPKEEHEINKFKDGHAMKTTKANHVSACFSWLNRGKNNKLQKFRNKVRKASAN